MHGILARFNSKRWCAMIEIDPEAQAHSARLQQYIQPAANAAGGRLPFDRFMELALYAPGLGYYMSGTTKLGRGGDFITAPEISPLFGQALAQQCAEVLAALNGGSIVELGAGSGMLAATVLERLAELDQLPEQYLILELSPELRERQQTRIAAQVPDALTRVRWIQQLPDSLRGVILANEVADALPVQRFRIADDGAIQELFVAADDQAPAGWREHWDTPESPGLHEAVTRLHAQGLAQAPGYCSEVNLRLAPWLRAVAAPLTAGLVLIIDYGYPQDEYYHPARDQGTLLCYYRHQALADPYQRLGLQDITAHVDFTALAEAGLAAGLALAGFTTQAHFLLGCGVDELMTAAAEKLPPADFAALAAGAKQLLLPSQMGERFRVLGLSAGQQKPWRGFALRDLSARL